MPQRLRQTIKWKNFNLPVSYNSDVKDRMRDARNVYTNKDRLDTRHGVQRWNTTQIENGEPTVPNVQSVTYFKKTDGSKYYIVKCGTVLYSVSESSTHTVLKTGLTAANKHRQVTFNDRAIIAIEDDGLFTFDGTTFTQLGEDAPNVAVTVAASGSGNTLPASNYQVAFTYYASSIGFETNLSDASATVTVAAGEQIDVSNIPTNPTNDLIDRKRIYIKDVISASDWLFWDEINLAVTTETIDSEISSTQTPPTKNARPIGGNAKFLDKFGEKLIIAGINGLESDVLFSEVYLPDAFDDGSSTRLVFKAGGDGEITGIKVGFYTSDNLSPYLCIFKRRAIEIYSELGGLASYSTVSSTVGAVSQDTILEIDGDIVFMSETGWHVISNGRINEKKGRAFRLGDGDIDSIFTEEGFTYEINKSNTENFFSVYYQTLNQYITFISEAGNTNINKAYNYEFDIGGFRPYEFPIGYTSACVAEDASGDSFVLIGGNDGYLYKHGLEVSKHDVDSSNSSVNIDAFAQLYWINHDDLDATMNFGTLILKGLDSDNDVTVKLWLDYNLTNVEDRAYSFTGPNSGFILDESKLDEGILGDGRDVVRSIGQGVYKTSQSLLIGFYQNILDANLGLVSGQLDASKNGNPN